MSSRPKRQTRPPTRDGSPKRAKLDGRAITEAAKEAGRTPRYMDLQTVLADGAPTPLPAPKGKAKETKEAREAKAKKKRQEKEEKEAQRQARRLEREARTKEKEERKRQKAEAKALAESEANTPKAGCKWLDFEVADLLDVAEELWCKPKELRMSSAAFNDALIKKAHDADKLLVRTNSKSIGHKFGWCRSTWKDVDAKKLSLMVERKVLRPVKPPSGGRSDDDMDFEQAMAEYEDACAACVQDAMAAIIPGDAKFFPSWEKIFAKSPFGSRLEGDGHDDRKQREAKALADAKQKTREKASQKKQEKVDMVDAAMLKYIADKTPTKPATPPQDDALFGQLSGLVNQGAGLQEILDCLFADSTNLAMVAAKVFSDQFILTLRDVVDLRDADVRELFPQVGLRNRVLRCVERLRQIPLPSRTRIMSSVSHPVKPVAKLAKPAKQPAVPWACEACTFVNDGMYLACGVCRTAKSAGPNAASPKTAPMFGLGADDSDSSALYSLDEVDVDPVPPSIEGGPEELAEDGVAEDVVAEDEVISLVDDRGYDDSSSDGPMSPLF